MNDNKEKTSGVWIPFRAINKAIYCSSYDDGDAEDDSQEDDTNSGSGEIDSARYIQKPWVIPGSVGAN